MKRITTIASLSLMVAFMAMTGLTASAQSSWSTSKAVNKVANPTVFNSDELKGTHLEVNSNPLPSAAISKGVSRVSLKASRRNSEKNNVASTGTPAWVYSKQVVLVGSGKSSSRSNQKGSEKMIPIDKKENFRQ